MSVALAVAAVLVFGASPEGGAEVASAPGEKPVELVKKGDRMICENVRRIGTRMPTRVCHTEAERQLMREGARRKHESFTEPGRQSRK